MSLSHAAERIGTHFYSAVFACPVIGVALWDEELRFVEGNAALGTIFQFADSDDPGKSPDESRLGHALDEIVPMEQRSRFDELLKEAAESQTSRLFELANVGDGGASRVLVAALGVKALGGGLCLFIDTSGRAPRPRGQDIGSRTAAIGILAAGVAHEINNPLAYTMGNLSFAIEHLEAIAHSTPELSIVILALRDALEGAERVRSTVSGLKTFSRPASESKGPVDLDRVLHAAISMARVDIQHRARIDVDVGVVPLVKGSEPHLAQVFLTLLLHAALHSEEGRVEENEVRVTARQTSPEEVTVDIVCTGDDNREKSAAGILDLGSADSDDERAVFGLAFCRRVAEQYGNAISIDADDPGKSPTGEGGSSSTVHVRLAVSTDAPAISEAPSRVNGGIRRARVLVVDDEPRIGSAITRILGPLHDVAAVLTAKEALDRLEGGDDYDVILCDLMMPQMSGADLYHSLEARAPRFTSRMVFMTGGPFSMRGASLLETVPNLRLEKPFSPETLRAVVEKFVS